MYYLAALLILLAVPTAGAEPRAELRWGLPEGRTIERSSYVVVWNGRTRCPDVVAEYLTGDRLDGNYKRDGMSFRSDPSVPREFRPILAEYNNTGFDYGHLAAAANHKRSVAELADTFIITNVCPQPHDFNGGAWAKLESYAREIAANPNVPATWIYTGPAWWAEPDESLHIARLGEIWIPTHFWKVVAVPNGDDVATWAWLMPADAQSGDELDRFAVNINTIEKVTGLDLLDALPNEREEKLEALNHRDQP